MIYNYENINSLLLQVMPKHVKEAYRLLNKSIIRVDQPDIHLDEDETEMEAEMEVDDPEAAAADAPAADQVNALSLSNNYDIKRW